MHLFLRFRWHEAGGEWKEVLTHLVGAYNLDNMLAAIAIGLHFGVSTQQICHALENYVPSTPFSANRNTTTNLLLMPTMLTLQVHGCCHRKTSD